MADDKQIESHSHQGKHDRSSSSSSDEADKQHTSICHHLDKKRDDEAELMDVTP